VHLRHTAVVTGHVNAAEIEVVRARNRVRASGAERWAGVAEYDEAGAGSHRAGEQSIIHPPWYSSIPITRSVRSIIVMWCRYNSYCPPYVRSQASSPFNRTVRECTEALETINFVPIMLPNVNRFQKFFQRKLSSKFVANQQSKIPPRLKRGAILLCDLSLIAMHVSMCLWFSDFNISLGSVATRLRCGGIFNFHFIGNLLLSGGERSLFHQNLVTLWTKYSGTFYFRTRLQIGWLGLIVT